MEYKDDWEQAEERMRAFFAGDIIDRPVVLVTAPKKGVCQTPVNPWHILMNNLDDPDLVFEKAQQHFRQTWFGGEAFPFFNLNLGPGSTAAYMGGKRQVMETTVWFEQEESTPWEKVLSLKLLPDEAWWKLTREVTDRAAALGGGHFLIGMPDFNAPLNLLGFWRGTQTLLMDLWDAPDKVRQGSRLMTDIWHQCYDILYPAQQRAQAGTIDWMGIWYPGAGSNVQCDFSAMISPAMFEEFVLPNLREQCRRLDHSIYHWDGPGQIPHLDLLLSIPELDAIQWTPGAGREPVGSPQWFPLYRRIRQAGKSVVLLGIAPEHIERVMSELGPEKLLVTTATGSEDEGRELLKKAGKWACRRDLTLSS